MVLNELSTGTTLPLPLMPMYKYSAEQLSNPCYNNSGIIFNSGTYVAVHLFLHLLVKIL
jgi:hypothetical protein